MSEFLTDEWLDELNARLRRAGPVPSVRESGLRVVFELSEVPATAPGNLTMTLAPEGADVTADAPAGRDATIRLSYVDARRLYAGELDGAVALREGRLKILGDATTLVDVADWLARAREDSPE